MESALYTGFVRHRRFARPEHDFRLGLFMTWLDLDELHRVFEGSWVASTRRLALLRFHRADHLGDPERPLDECVRDVVVEHGGPRPRGPVRMLTHLRFAGFVFNPVTLYYCYSEDGRSVEAVVAEVTNTPWGEQHCYVLRPAADGVASRQPKAFHVSPFQPMEQEYVWSLPAPGPVLAVGIESREDDRRRLAATLRLERRELDPASLRRTLLRWPFMSLRVVVAIYLHALRLWLRGARFHPHPSRRARAREARA